MPDWDSVPLNVGGVPMGYVSLTPSNPPGIPFYLDASGIILVLEEGPNTAIVTGAGRVVVKENIREVFRRKAEANTVEPVIAKTSLPPGKIRTK